MEKNMEGLHKNEQSGAAMQTAPEDLIFYGTKELAKFLHCSVPIAREVMKRKDFPCLKVGTKFMVSKSALEAWAMERRV